jgi:hypothetical protein
VQSVECLTDDSYFIASHHPIRFAECPHDGEGRLEKLRLHDTSLSPKLGTQYPTNPIANKRSYEEATGTSKQKPYYRANKTQ